MMAKTWAKSYPLPLLVFSVLTEILSLGCCSEVHSDSDDYSSALELNRDRRDIIHSAESLRNIKAFDSGSEFQNVKDTIKYVTKSPDGGNDIPMEVTVFPPPDFQSLSCRDFQTDLGTSVANFTQCAILNARPINVCCYCVHQFNDTLNAYDRLVEASESGTECKNVLFSKDRLEIVQTMYNSVPSLWNQANCYSCYALVNGSRDLSIVSDETLNFFQALRKVTECFENITFSEENANDTCSRCKPFYEHLGAVYDGIVKDLINNQPTEEVCADIADHMNITHHLWNNQFKCKLFDTDVGYALIVLTVSLGSVPILFYLAAKVLSNVETILLVLPRRKLFVPDSGRVQM